MTPSSLLLGLSGLALSAGSALAQTKPAEPIDAKASVPPQVYRSNLQSYKPFSEAELADWRAANQRVHAAGGWRSYAKEAAAAASAPASAPTHKH